jgi:antitoxin YefM
VEVLNYSELRKNLAEHLNQVAEENELLVISRGEGKNVVLISLDDYNALNETVHLLSSSANIRRLEESMQEMEKGEFKRHNLKEK